MPIPNYTDDLNVIAALPDEPNVTGGLTAQEMKAKFDQGGLMIQEWINSVLIPQLNQSIGLLAAVNSLDVADLTNSFDHLPTSAAVYSALGSAVAKRLKSPVNITLENGASGSVNTDLSGDVSIPVTLNPNYMSQAVPVSKGGTGGTTAETGRANLGLAYTDILDKVYPVGALYISAANTDPATLFGFGTWTRIKDRFLLAAGDTYSNGSTGGEAAHTLLVTEIPPHYHDSTEEIHYYKSGEGAYGVSAGQNTKISAIRTGITGGGGAHNNMPPYLTVNVWQRTA